MKKLLLSLSILGSITASAQLPSGGQAPDFITEDIFGNTVNLSEILASGRAVYMDISATWCGPCWSFHQSHILEDIYYAYGEGGSDEVFPIFVEGDSTTTIEDLMGTGSNTQGDWVTDSPYTIVDDASIASAYDIAYFPTFFTICSDGTLNHWDQSAQGYYLSTEDLEEYFDELCGMSIEGVANHAKIEAPELFYLCGDGAVDLEASIKNFGNNEITSATIELVQDGNTIATQSFSGSLDSFESEEVEFENVQLDSASEYKIVLASVNGGSPFSTDESIVEANVEFELSEQVTSSTIQVNVTTDTWPSEISWDITDSAGNIIIGDAYDGPDQNGPNVNTTFTYEVSLPDGSDCYTVNYYDEYGDGWGYNVNAGIEIIANDEIVYSEQVGSFGTELNRENAFGADVLGVNEIESNSKLAVYPNPTSGVINIKSVETVSIKVTNMTGKQVAVYKGVEANTSLDLSHLAKGVYVLQIDGEQTNQTKKLIIK